MDTCSPRMDPGPPTHWHRLLSTEVAVMTCNHSSSDLLKLKPITQKTGATSLSVFLGQDQAKFKNYIQKVFVFGGIHVNDICKIIIRTK